MRLYQKVSRQLSPGGGRVGELNSADEKKSPRAPSTNMNEPESMGENAGSLKKKIKTAAVAGWRDENYL